MDFAMTFSYMCMCFPIMFSTITLLSPSPSTDLPNELCMYFHVLSFFTSCKTCYLTCICFTKVSVDLSFHVSSHTEFLKGIAFLQLTSDNRNIMWAMYGILNLPVVWGSQHAVILICNQPKLHWHIFHSFCSHWVSKVHCLFYTTAHLRSD